MALHFHSKFTLEDVQNYSTFRSTTIIRNEKWKAELANLYKKKNSKRLNAYNNTARNRVPGTPFGEHWRRKHPDKQLAPGETALRNVSVIANGQRDRATRKLRESAEIRDTKPEINLSQGWELLL